ncbi:MAG: S8 family peptidase [Fimbriimonadaceae bacterium]
MKLTKIFLSIAALAAAIVINAAPEFVEDEVLVKFKPGSTQLERLVQGEVIEEIPNIGVKRIRLPYGWNVPDMVKWFNAQPGVEFAEPNFIARADVNDQYYTPSIQWGLFKIQSDSAWNYTGGGSSYRKVAVIDTGWQRNHPDLVGKVVGEVDYVDGGTADDGNGHGTHTAGIVGAKTNNTIGVASIGYNTSLLIVRVLNNSGSGTYSAIANGINWSANNGAHVINMSLGGSSGSQTLLNAVNYAWGRGVVVVASAGNNGNTAPNYPAYYSNCIAVASTTSTDARSSFSTYGSWVDVAAPGSNIASTYTGSRYVYLSGTSMAAPMVAGTAALVWTSSYGTSATSVRNRITTTGDTVTSGFGSYPTKRINAARAVGAIP